MPRRVSVLIALTLAVPLAPGLRAQDAAVFYDENCAMCHTIGEGPMGGPDLKGVTARRDREWLIAFLLDTGAFANDPIVKKMIAEADGMEMPPTEGLTRELAEAILSVVDRRSGGALAPAAAERPVTPGDVDLGRALFTGHARLSAAGAPCAACHAAGDLRAPQAGRLGPDLARVHDRLGGQRGVSTWLGSPPTAMMRALYRSAPPTDDEAHALAAFLAIEGDQAGAPSSTVQPFVVAGSAGSVLVLAIIGAAWTRRFRAVRRPLVARARHSQLGPRHAPGAGGSQ
jgi:cytochrome c2